MIASLTTRMTAKTSFAMQVLICLAACASAPAFAVQITVQNPCAASFWLEQETSFQAGQTVGSVSIAAFDKAKLQFEGSPSGIRSIGGTPTGDAAVEVLSDAHMRAYGWCFSLNGVEPAEMPDQVDVNQEGDIIRWYFGYAEYKSGAWISYCTPTHVARPDFICGN